MGGLLRGHRSSPSYADRAGLANVAIIGRLFLAAGAIAMAWLASVAANLLSSDMKGSREQMSA